MRYLTIREMSFLRRTSLDRNLISYPATPCQYKILLHSPLHTSSPYATSDVLLGIFEPRCFLPRNIERADILVNALDLSAEAGFLWDEFTWDVWEGLASFPVLSVADGCKQISICFCGPVSAKSMLLSARYSPAAVSRNSAPVLQCCLVSLPGTITSVVAPNLVLDCRIPVNEPTFRSSCQPLSV
jgi:hypothetical protein